jgi:hypothetical protein
VRITSRVAGVLGALLLSGCATGPDGLATPRIRVGGLPYPGFTNYLMLEPPHALGEHRYQRLRGAGDEVDEVSLGIVYTRHGGFIDLAHIRSTVDWVRYVYLVALAQLMAPDPQHNDDLRWSWLGIDFQLRVHVPPEWAALPIEQRHAMSRASAAVLAQRMATVISTWHEVGSWYGQMIVPPFQEIRSAFTWDDSSSHVFAALVGGRALATSQPHNQADWNRAVTRELAAALAALGPVDKACQHEALARTRGAWWYSGSTLRRDLDTGLQGPAAKQAWLVPELACADGAQPSAPNPSPFPFVLPNWQALERAPGALPQPRYDWEVTLPHWLTQKVLGCEEVCHGQVFKGEAALLKAIERIRDQIALADGAQALLPHPLAGTVPTGAAQAASSAP